MQLTFSSMPLLTITCASRIFYANLTESYIKERKMGQGGAGRAQPKPEPTPNLTRVKILTPIPYPNLANILPNPIPI